MHVLILGGGVVGVTTAYQLLQDGHKVTLLERNARVGDETSWGNAGMVAPGHSFAWSSPRAPGVLFRSLYKKNQALRFKPSMDPRLWTWSWKFLMQCTEARARHNTLRKHKLAVYSQQVLHETIAVESDIKYDRNDRGLLFFYRSQETLDKGVAHMKILADDGQELKVLSRAELLKLEPALASAGDKIAGGLVCPTDETGDCSLFTKAMGAKCIERGADFRTGVTISSIEASGDTITEVRTDKGNFKADHYVLALGSQSPMLTRSLSIDLPIYPVKGYSLTIPVGNHPMPPTMGAIDEDNLVAISRFGDRVRVTATAEFAGYDKSHKPSDFDFMKSVAQDLYPEGADYGRAEMWAGLRPMTPTNLPILGRKRHRNLVYNTGHGHIGWTMSHGTARLTADLISGKTPAMPVESVSE